MKTLHTALKEIWIRIQTDYEDDLEEGIKQTEALFKQQMEEIIGDGKPQFLRKSKLKEDIAWCKGRNQLRAELRERIKKL